MAVSACCLGAEGIATDASNRFANLRRSPPPNALKRGAELAPVESTDSSSLFSAFFLDRSLLTHFDVVRSRYVTLSMPNTVSKLPFPTAGDVTAAR